MSGSAEKSTAQRLEALQPFLAMEVMERAFELEAEGVDVVHLEIGEPRFSPPPQAVEACVQALEGGETQYTDSRGLAELREAIAADCERRCRVAPDPSRILVASGTSPAMLLVFSLLVDPGDEVIIPSPHYPCYPNFVRFCGGVPVYVPTHAETGFAIDVESVAAAITPRTKAIVVASPANPTGAVQSADTMRALAALGPPLISDEIYAGIVYDGARVTSALTLDADAFVLDGFSKRYAMTGFRLGWLVAPAWASRPLQIMQQSLFISANRFVQKAGIAALRHGAPYVASMRDACAKRRDRLVGGLRELGFSIPHMPAGAFYVLADARVFGSDSLALARELLERAHVGATPGIDFGEAGEGMLRFCYATSEEAIDEGLARLGRVLPELAASAAGGP
ncbi:MAG: pyridoxal phosphate-dependent aminotransferase [Deltaproteobacteria bacterium]|nr:pyridoxal phosphate-dependent aminotransferase [Deltaproteobacteria bacterium]MBW2382060.1 pyridoxal phosphate-dependent aminotransferase [Deltaproteobacteria bacterium]MBW2696272.1 pyridoxal phosphate-dependent aminotransferase [Deltaproteobacteria bacterium]